MRSYAYFLLAPTFCYQLWYPRTARIRKTWLLKRVAEFVILSCVQFYIIMEFFVPILSQAPAVFLKPKLDVVQAFSYVC